MSALQSLCFCNLPFIIWGVCVCTWRISAASTVRVRIQMAIGTEYKSSVSYLEYKLQEVWTAAKGALQWRMAIEMRQKNASEIKRRMSSAVPSTPALQLQLIPAPSASRHEIIFHNDTSVQISPSLRFFPSLNHHMENNSSSLFCWSWLWVTPIKAQKVFWVTQILLISCLSAEMCGLCTSSQYMHRRTVCVCQSIVDRSVTVGQKFFCRCCDICSAPFH